MTRLRAQVRTVLERGWVQSIVIALILINGVIIGLLTSAEIVAAIGDILELINLVIVVVFVFEITLRIFAEGWRFFLSAWNVFDFIVVGLALIPASSTSQVLRVLRILRVLRLLSVIRSMRLVVDSLAAAASGFASIAGLLGLVMYVFSVMSTMLFGQQSPEHFGSLGLAFVQHFRLMMGDGWPDVVTPVADSVWVWVYFIVYTVISALVVLNLLIAVVVAAMERKHEQIALEDAAKAAVAGAVTTAPETTNAELLAELRSLRAEVAALRGGPGPGSAAS